MVPALVGSKMSSGFVLCASPRSGSTLLCDLLTQSGVAGAPASYFRPGSVPGYAKQWAVPTGADGWDHRYVEAVARHGEAATGCFGLRVMGTDMPGLLERLARFYPGAGSDSERMRAVFGIEHFVHLSRVDIVAQAVSLVTAAQTGVWHRNADGTVLQGSSLVRPVQYDVERIASEVTLLETEQHWWASWFASQSIKPLELTYEQLAADPLAIANDVLEFVGLRSEKPLVIGTQRLATSVSVEWAKRFREERFKEERNAQERHSAAP